MVRTVVVLFLLAHGLLHPLMYAMPVKADASAPPFDVHRSWMLRAAHVSAPVAFSASVWLAWITGLLFVFAGAALLGGGAAWTAAATAGAVVGLVLKLGWFHPWLTVGVALDVGVLVAVAAAWPGSVF
ncbi:MAG TPA: hypothetical protein VM345_06715 [Acidimicrobiales bacterium]|jgi:hypothetical protein|nr:hypothetical protein [Acidimicrobiales bacterium]